MSRFPVRPVMVVALAVAAVVGKPISAQDKYAVQVPNGLSLAECRGYEDWPAVAVSQPERTLNLIVANPTMIEAYRAGVPGNGAQFPDGSRIMKILWSPRRSAEAPAATSVPGTLSGIGCMVKDSSRFRADTGGWGWAQFDYDPASDSFRPNTAMQGNDARCGAACHAAVRSSNFVFTAYPRR